MLHKGQYQKIDLSKTLIGILTEDQLPPEIAINLKELHTVIADSLDLE